MKANGDRMSAHTRTSRVRKVSRFSSLKSSEPRGLARAFDGALDLIYTQYRRDPSRQRGISKYLDIMQHMSTFTGSRPGLG